MADDEDDWSDEDNADGDGDGWSDADGDGDLDFPGQEDYGPSVAFDEADAEFGQFKRKRNMSERQAAAPALLNQYESVIELVNANPGEEQYRIQSLGRIVEIHLYTLNLGGAQGAFNALVEAYERKKNQKFVDVVKGLTFRVANIDDPNVQAGMDQAILEALRVHRKDEWVKEGAKVCRRYMKQNNFGPVEQMVEDFHAACRLPNGDDDTGKPDTLLDIYALKMELVTARGGDETELNDLVKRTQPLQASMAESAAMYTIHRCYGYIHAAQNQWETAYNDFFESFTRLVKDGASGEEKFAVLRYAVLSSMMSEASINPFAAEAARAEEQHASVQPMARMLYAFDGLDIRKFESVLYEARRIVEPDDFLRKYMPAVQTRLRSRVMVKLIKPYRRVRLDWLKKKLMTDDNGVEMLVVKCILDGSVKGRVDQINSVLDLEFGATKSDDLYDSLEQWMSAVKKMQSNLSSRTSRGHMGAFGGAWGDFDDEDFPLFQTDLFGFDGW